MSELSKMTIKEVESFYCKMLVCLTDKVAVIESINKDSYRMVIPHHSL